MDDQLTAPAGWQVRDFDLDIRPVGIGINRNVTGQKLIQGAGLVRQSGSPSGGGSSVSAIQPNGSNSSSSTDVLTASSSIASAAW